jgi:transposase
MTQALSVDLRDRVVAAMRDGASCREAAKLFRVSVASAARWSKRARDTGSVAPRPFGKPLGLVLLPERDWHLARLAAAPDLTIRALRAELEAERGVRVGYGAVWRFLTREGLTFKKNSACRRAAQAGRCTQARSLEAHSEKH